MPRLYDITGMRFGKLTAMECISTERRSRWLFRCDCGGTCVGMAQSAKCGDLKNCPDCRSAERSRFTKRHGATAGLKTRKRRDRLYDCWGAMRSRCRTVTCPHYHRYGGRGITICKDWDDYAAFRDWALANGYSDTLTIDRIDVDGNYEPTNCRWVTHQEQAQNKRQTRWVEYQGETMNLMQLAKRTGVSWWTLRGRLNAGLSVDEAVNHPKRGYLPTRRNYRGVRA